MATTPSQAEQQRAVESKREQEVAQIKGYTAAVDTGYKGSLGEFSKQQDVASEQAKFSAQYGYQSKVSAQQITVSSPQQQVAAERATMAQTASQIEQQQLQSVYAAVPPQGTQQDNLRYAAVALGLGTATLDTSTAEGKRIAEEYAKAKYSYTSQNGVEKQSKNMITLTQPEGQLYPTSYIPTYMTLNKSGLPNIPSDARIISAQSTKQGTQIITETPNIQPISPRTPEGIPASYYAGSVEDAQKLFDFAAPRIGVAIETAWKLNPLTSPQTYINQYTTSAISEGGDMKPLFTAGYSELVLGSEKILKGTPPSTILGQLAGETIVGVPVSIYKASQTPFIGIENVNILANADANRAAQLEFTGKRAKQESTSAAIETGLTGLTFAAFDIGGKIITKTPYPETVGARITENLHVTSFDSPFGDFGITGGFKKTGPAEVRAYSNQYSKTFTGSYQATGEFEVKTPMGKINELTLPASQTYTYTETPIKGELPTKLGGEKVNLIGGADIKYTGETRIYGVGTSLELSEKPRLYESNPFSGENVGYTGIGQKVTPESMLIRYPTYSVNEGGVSKGFFDLENIELGTRSKNIDTSAMGKVSQVSGGTKFEFSMPDVSGTRYTGEPTFSKYGKTQEKLEILHPSSLPTTETGAYSTGTIRDYGLSKVANLKSFSVGAGETPPPFINPFKNTNAPTTSVKLPLATRDLTLKGFSSYEQTNAKELGGLKNLFESKESSAFNLYQKPTSSQPVEQLYSKTGYNKPVSVQIFAETPKTAEATIPSSVGVRGDFYNTVSQRGASFVSGIRLVKTSESDKEEQYGTGFQLVNIKQLFKPKEEDKNLFQFPIGGQLDLTKEGQIDKVEQKLSTIELQKQIEISKIDQKIDEIIKPINNPPPPFDTEIKSPDNPPPDIGGGGLLGLQSSSGFDIGKRTKTKGKYQPSFIAVQLGIKSTGISKSRSEISGLGIRPLSQEKPKKMSDAKRIGGILKSSSEVSGKEKKGSEGKKFWNILGPSKKKNK